jgi:hypothetical protein
MDLRVQRQLLPELPSLLCLTLLVCHVVNVNLRSILMIFCVLF